MGLMFLDFEFILRLFFHLERFLSKQAELFVNYDTTLEAIFNDQQYIGNLLLS